MESLSPDDFVGYLSRDTTLYTSTSPSPSTNRLVLRSLVQEALRICPRELGDVFYVFDNGLVLERRNGTLIPPLSNAFSHGRIAEDVSGSATLLEQCAGDIHALDLPLITEALWYPKPVGALLANCYPYVHSPVVDLAHDTFDSYLASLTSKRRYKVKKAVSDARHTLIVTGSLSDADIDRVFSFLSARWQEPELIDFALFNFLPTLCCNRSLFARLYVGDKLLALGYFTCQLDTYVFQGIAINPELDSQDVGISLLSNFILHLIQTQHCGADGTRVRYLDVTAMTQMENSSVDTYKRHVVNQNLLLPFLTAVPNAVYAQEEGLYPPFYDTQTRLWVQSPEPYIFGAPL